MEVINDETIIEQLIEKHILKKELNGKLKKFPQLNYLNQRQLVKLCLLNAGEEYKKQFPDLINYLKKFEKFLFTTNRYYRDHLVHTFRVWALGLYLYEIGLKDYFMRDSTEDPYFQFVWYLAATYHDIGYPFEKITEITKSINNILQFPDNIVNLNLDFNFPENNSLEALWRDIFNKVIDYPLLKLNHGYFSAYLLLMSLNHYHGSFWNPSARKSIKAIGLHASDEEIDILNDPYSGFLLLCDELQDWGRYFIPALGGEKYIVSDHILLDIGKIHSRWKIEVKIPYKYPRNHKLKEFDIHMQEQQERENRYLARLKNVTVEIQYI